MDLLLHGQLGAALNSAVFDLLSQESVALAPTHEDQVAAAERAAITAAAHADVCWKRFSVAAEHNTGVATAHAELMAAVAQQVYAWAVYHSTASDAASNRSPAGS